MRRQLHVQFEHFELFTCLAVIGLLQMAYLSGCWRILRFLPRLKPCLMRGCCELHVQSPGLKQTRYSNTGEHKVHSMQHLTGSPGHVFTCVGVGRPEMHLCFEIHVLQLKSVSECLQYTMQVYVMYISVLDAAMFSTNTC